jgi:hypothetical protein
MRHQDSASENMLLSTDGCMHGKADVIALRAMLN